MGGRLGQQPEVALAIDPPLGKQQLFARDAGTQQEMVRIPPLGLPVGEAELGYPVGYCFHGKNPCRLWSSIIRQRRKIAVSQRWLHVSKL
jgi:hypothetical protein